MCLNFCTTLQVYSMGIALQTDPVKSVDQDASGTNGCAKKGKLFTMPIYNNQFYSFDKLKS